MQSISKSGFILADEPFVYFSSDADLAEVLKSLIEVSGKSKLGIPDPKDWVAFEKKYLAALGFKTWKAVDINKVRMVTVKIEMGNIYFVPTKKDDKNIGGFYDNEEAIASAPIASSIQEKTHLLQEALNKCQ